MDSWFQKVAGNDTFSSEAPKLQQGHKHCCVVRSRQEKPDQGFGITSSRRLLWHLLPARASCGLGIAEQGHNLNFTCWVVITATALSKLSVLPEETCGFHRSQERCLHLRIANRSNHTSQTRGFELMSTLQFLWGHQKST